MAWIRINIPLLSPFLHVHWLGRPPEDYVATIFQRRRIVAWIPVPIIGFAVVVAAVEGLRAGTGLTLDLLGGLLAPAASLALLLLMGNSARTRVEMAWILSYMARNGIRLTDAALREKSCRWLSHGWKGGLMFRLMRTTRSSVLKRVCGLEMPVVPPAALTGPGFE